MVVPAGEAKHLHTLRLEVPTDGFSSVGRRLSNTTAGRCATYLMLTARMYDVTLCPSEARTRTPVSRPSRSTTGPPLIPAVVLRR